MSELSHIWRIKGQMEVLNEYLKALTDCKLQHSISYKNIWLSKQVLNWTLNIGEDLPDILSLCTQDQKGDSCLIEEKALVTFK